MTEAGARFAFRPPETDRLTACAVPLIAAVWTLLVAPAPCWSESAVGVAEMLKSLGGGVQPGNLNEPMRVRQLKLPFEGMYSVVYQKVQSSTGSTDIML